MIGIIYATGFEAKPFLELSRAEPDSRPPFKMYHAKLPFRIPIIISDIGKVAASVACHQLIREFGVDYIINAGACGALHDSTRDSSLKIGSLVRIASAGEGDHTPFEKLLPPITGAGRFARFLPAVRLITSDKPVFDPIAKEYFGNLGDVVDMEGGAIARVADLYNLPWDMVKGVSDAAEVTDREILRRNLDEVCGKIARVLLEELSNMHTGGTFMSEN